MEEKNSEIITFNRRILELFINNGADTPKCDSLWSLAEYLLLRLLFLQSMIVMSAFLYSLFGVSFLLKIKLKIQLIISRYIYSARHRFEQEEL